jgi:hypothetical protein
MPRLRLPFTGPGRRPKGGRADAKATTPPAPQQAGGQPPESPADAFSQRKVSPPRPLVWVGTGSSGSAVWSSPVADRAGQQMWSELSSVASEARCWPVLTGGAPLPSTWRLADALPPDTALPEPDGLLRRRAQSLPTAPEGFRTRLEPSPVAVVETDLTPGYLALVSDAMGWQVPLAVGLTGLGDWSASEHAAVLRHWSERYRARLVALTDTSVGLWVERPPTTHDDALVAAAEIYAYCPDAVLRGVRSMWALATTVAVSSVWSLRWSS